MGETDVLKTRRLIPPSASPDTQKVHPKFDIQKSASISARLHYRFGMNQATSYRRTDEPRIRGQFFLGVFLKNQEMRLKLKIKESN